MDSTLLKRAKTADKRSKDVVFGYIKQYESNSLSLLLIKHLCLAYYLLTDTFYGDYDNDNIKIININCVL